MSLLPLKLNERANACLKGQTMTEYAMILATIAIVCYVAYQSLGTNISTVVTNLADDL